MTPRLHVPEPLAGHHRLEGFTCGLADVDTFLATRARANSERGASRVFVSCDDDNNVFAYYTLSSGSIIRSGIPCKYRHGSPDPVPVLLIGRFGVDQRAQGNGVGRWLLQDALVRCGRLSTQIGFQFLMLHAANETADSFWRRFGFTPSPIIENTLMLDARTLPVK